MPRMTSTTLRQRLHGLEVERPLVTREQRVGVVVTVDIGRVPDRGRSCCSEHDADQAMLGMLL